MFRTRTGSTLGAVLAAAALVVSGCSGSSSSGGDSKVLKLWHYEAPTTAQAIAWNAAIKQFESAHRGVTVQFEEKSFDQIQQNAGMMLNSGDAPDVMEYNKGNATAGLLSKQGLLTDLTQEVTKRGWDKVLNTGLTTTAKYDARGVMGGDKWFGVPNYGEYVMVYYNKDLFTKHHVAVPKTFDELTAAMGALKQAMGTAPLAFSGADYVSVHLFYELTLAKADRAWVDNYQLKGGADFHGRELTYAAETMADWVKKGYVAKDTAAVKADDAALAFEQGKAPIFFSGSWWYARFAKEMQANWGTFLFPGNKLQVGSSGNLWVVPSKSKNKQLAYDFIDITLKKDIQNLMGNSGGIPIAADAAAITDPKSKELIDNWNTIEQADGIGFYPDWPVAGYYDVLVRALQDLLNGSKTPAQTLDVLAKAYKDGAGK